MKNHPFLISALAGSLILLSGCGQKDEQPQASKAEAHSAQPAEPASMAASKPAEQSADADHQVQGAMTAAKVPQQPEPPADPGQQVYGQCVGCHGPQGGGGVGPKLAGQPKDVLVQKLTDYKAGKQMGPQTAMMAPIAQGLSEKDIEAVTNYIATHFK